MRYTCSLALAFLLSSTTAYPQGVKERHSETALKRNASSGSLRQRCSQFGNQATLEDRPFNGYTEAKLLDLLRLAADCVSRGNDEDRLSGLLIGEQASIELTRSGGSPLAITNEPSAASISIGSVQLTLGMPQDVVLGRLADQYDVRKQDGANYFVYPQGASPNESSIATVVFRDRTLSAVDKGWSRNEQKASRLATALYDAIAGFKQEGNVQCGIDVGQAQEPDSDSKSAFITCGGKYIRIDVIRLQDGTELASVDEVLDRK